jgi:hypothetical protein
MLAAACAGAAHAIAPQSLDGSSTALRGTWAALRGQPANAPFKEPLHLESSQSEGSLSGKLYATIDKPFAAVQRALSEDGAWCAILILDPNVHRCQSRPAQARQPALIEVGFGDSDTAVSFSQSIVRAEDYLQARLSADNGPFGTTDYAIALEAAPLDNDRTIVHLAFSQHFNWGARVALLAYFNTVGRGKVGFSVVDRDASGRPVYVSELRGGLERNLMRYYFAVLAYLHEQQPDRRVRTWLAYTERYPLQLREEAGYFERKSPDVRRQQSER